jgi:hypothetical protein
VWKEKTDSPGVGYPEVITLPEPRIGNDESASVFKCFPLMLPYNAHTAELASSLLFSLIRNDERTGRDETSRLLAMVGLRHRDNVYCRKISFAQAERRLHPLRNIRS